MTRDKMSECLGLFVQRLKIPRPESGEEMDVGDNQFNHQFPRFERVDHRTQEPEDHSNAQSVEVCIMRRFLSHAASFALREGFAVDL